MLLTMLSLPVLASIVVGTQGRYLGAKGTNYVIIGSLFISTLLSLIIGYEVILKASNLSLIVMNWFDTGLINVDWGFVIDPLGAWLTTTVLMISLLVHIFASSYMATDPNPQRFMSLLTAFTAGMVCLVTGDTLAVLFVGWEIIGVTSFLLIGFWWDRSAACNAASQAIVINRIGDLSFTLALILILTGASTLDFSCLGLVVNIMFQQFSNSNDISGLAVSSYSASQTIETMIIYWAGIFLVFAAFGKSAQFFLHTWLVRSMEGPTPVSALLHAATLVAGGTYLLLRSFAVVNVSDSALIIAALIGTITAVFAGTSALFQFDAKRIIAYSTCSQFGYLTASIGLSQTNSTLFHLSSHSGFKALLFITAGGIIHATNDSQDIRKLGGLVTSLPYTYTGMLIGSLSLIATPYLAGFYSKDLILEIAIATGSWSSSFFWVIGSIVAGLTACYSTRLLGYVFWGAPSGPKKTYEMTHEQPLGVILPISVLSILAITFGYFSKESIIGFGSGTGAFNGVTNSYITEAEFGLDLLTKNFPLICTLLGISLGLFFFVLGGWRTQRLPNSFNLGTSVYLGLNNKWWVDAIYAKAFSWPGLNLSLHAFKNIDRGIVELLGPKGLNDFLTKLSFGSFPLATQQLTIHGSSEAATDLIPTRKDSSWMGSGLPDYGTYVVMFIVFILGCALILGDLSQMQITTPNLYAETWSFFAISIFVLVSLTASTLFSSVY